MYYLHKKITEKCEFYRKETIYMNISIIVLSHNNEHISLVLKCLLRQLKKDDEIIVVDDHSETAYLKKLELFTTENNIVLIHANKINNRSHNRNIGAKYAQGQILLFVDGDMILIDNALMLLRDAHTYNHQKAFIGPKHNIHYDEIHFELFTGIKNYIELLDTPEGRKQLSEDYFSRDERKDFFADSSNQKFFWMHYYTGASSVSREIFEKCAGFDENFTSWGSEDVDFGYRISKYCDIGFLDNFHSFHIPHNRDTFAIETSNMNNILQMLEKYKTWEFEALYAFNGNPNIHKSVYNIINQMRTLPLLPIKNIDATTFLIINTISKEYPYGNVITFDGNTHKEYRLLGLAIPFKNKTFHTICISEDVFIYPPILVSRILQEALRVGEKVYIQKRTTNIRIDWNGKIFFPFQSTNHKIAYRSEDIMDYSFEAMGDKINVFSNLPENVVRNPIFWENE